VFCIAKREKEREGGREGRMEGGREGEILTSWNVIPRTA